MKMNTLMAVSRRPESKLVSEDIAVVTVPWDLVLTGTRVLKTEKVPIQGIPRRIKHLFFEDCQNYLLVSWVIFHL